MDGVCKSFQTRDQMIGIGANLPRRALASLLDIHMPRDEETSAALCQVRVEPDESIGDLTFGCGHGLRCCGSNQAIANFHRTNSTRGKVGRVLH